MVNCDNHRGINQINVETLKYPDSMKTVERIVIKGKHRKKAGRLISPDTSQESKLSASNWESVNAYAKYKIGAVIAKGGIGQVLLAFDKNIGRKVAIKQLQTHQPEKENGVFDTQQELNARFIREARVTGQLEHPSIIPVYEVGVKKDGALYYTMRLIRGQTMEAAIRLAGSLDQRLLLLPHYLDLCNAIAYAHSKGVIHRDIKPSNIMIGEFGETVVIDWGLAKVMGECDEEAEVRARDMRLFHESQGTVTLAGATLGTPVYMSPEQARGEIDIVDERSDIYGLGAVLYEIITGRPIYEGITAKEVLDKVIHEYHTPISDYEPRAPQALISIATRALAKRRSARHESARQLVEEVERYLATRDVTIESIATADLLNRIARRHPIVSGISILALIVLLLNTMYHLAWHHEGESPSIKAATNTHPPKSLSPPRPSTHLPPQLRLADNSPTRLAHP